MGIMIQKTETEETEKTKCVFSSQNKKMFSSRQN